MAAYLSVQDVVKRYASHTALSGVSLEAGQGRVFGLLGPNGAGKTTLIRIINRITLPDSGQICLGGRPMQPADVARIGYLPEERGLYRKMRVGEQAIYLARLKGLGEREARRRLQEWFERLDILPWWDRKLEELSKGMQQKVQFVITVLHEPELLIFDEPFSGFDPLNAELLKREILRLRDQGRTVVFSTHNMASVEEVCDSFALIRQGEVVLSGGVQQVKEQQRTGRFALTATAPTLGERPELYTITGRTQRTAGSTLTDYELQAAPGVTGSELVSAVAGQVEVRAFSEQLPTMNEIFIRQCRTARS